MPLEAALVKAAADAINDRIPIDTKNFIVACFFVIPASCFPNVAMKDIHSWC